MFLTIINNIIISKEITMAILVKFIKNTLLNEKLTTRIQKKLSFKKAIKSSKLIDTALAIFKTF